MPSAEKLETQISQLHEALEQVKDPECNLSEIMAEFSKSIELYCAITQAISTNLMDVREVKLDENQNCVEHAFDWEHI